MSGTSPTLGDRLKGLRKERGESQIVVATAVGMSRSHLANIEKGRDTPGWETALALAAYYGCSLDWLTSMSGELKHGSAAATSENEALLLYLYRALPTDEADAILKLLFGRVRPKDS